MKILTIKNVNLKKRNLTQKIWKIDNNNKKDKDNNNENSNNDNNKSNNDYNDNNS